MADPYQIALGSFGQVPIPRWSVHGIGVLGLCACALWLYQQAASSDVFMQKQRLLAMQQEMAEAQAHLGQTPETVFADPDGALRVQVFSDHAVLLLRKDGSRVWTRLVPDLAKQPVTAMIRRMASGVAEASEPDCQPRHGHNEQPGGPAYGEKDGCVVRVYWTFRDGCRYYQLYDACRQGFEANADGSPRLHWVNCR